ncbi:hypothetical protein M426DRAFT_18150 [Hypoxylon sp. CI-4A]|nr:hypothetical protein M426DRAFT_18150 [Hypoxylon sp. CI-4A]
MRAQALILLVAPLALAAKPRARAGVPKSIAQNKLTNTLATCGAGYLECENSCMPFDGNCCNDNTDEYCPGGYYCIPDACCLDGETCDDFGDDDDDDSDYNECELDEVPCGDLCIPWDGTCCADELHYCPDFGTCGSDGFCDDDFWGDDGGFTDSSTSTDYEFLTSASSSDSTTTTAETTTTESSSHTTPTSSATEDSNADAPITAAPTATVTTTVSQQAGGVFTADSRMAAGLAVVAALLV